MVCSAGTIQLTGASHKPDINVHELLAGLRDIVPAQTVINDPASLRAWECDGLPLYCELPLAVVMPRNAAEVSAIMSLCHRLDVPVVPRGSGTGLSAGAMPHPEGVVISLAGLDRIVDIDILNRTARVQPGVPNLSISEAVACHGLFYAPDPSSQIACSIGGNVAENAGGVHCLKYGLTVHNVVGLTLITAEGETLTLGSSGLDTPGPDLLALMIGSEGLLGVVVEITVKLLPLPDSVAVIMAGFDTVTAAGDAVGQVIAAGILPAGLEMMDALAIQAAEDFAGAGYPRNAAALLLCELDGNAAEVTEQCNAVSDLLHGAGATRVEVATDSSTRQRLWRGRKSAFPAVGRLSPDYYCMDGTIPRRHVAQILAEISDMAKQSGLRVANVFHAGDGNLHPLILFDASKPEELSRAEALGARILERSVALGGSISGEHGVGLEKLQQMSVQFNNAELLQLEAIKVAFDPALNLNPGKGIPVLKRCQEYRALPARHHHG